MKNIKFGMDELLALILVSLVSAFIFSFKDWGINGFDFNYGAVNLLRIFAIVILSLLVKFSVQKYFSYREGFDAVFRPWYLGILIGIILIFATNGVFIFLAFGGLAFNIIENLRLGKVKYDLSFGEIGWLSMIGPAVSLIIAVAAKLLTYSSLNNEVLSKIMMINIWLAVFSLLPIPFVFKFKAGQAIRMGEFGTSDGLKLLYASPLEYFIAIAIFFIDMIAILLLSPKHAFYITIFCMIMLYIIYVLFYKNNIKNRKDTIFRYKFE